MNFKRFLLVQILFMSGAALYLYLGHRQYVAAAIVQVSYRVMAPRAADELTSPDDVEFAGTIARGFMEQGVLDEVVRKHPGAGMTAESIQKNAVLTPYRLNRTITLRLKSPNPDAACEIVRALLEERLRLDSVVQREANQPAIQGIAARIEELRTQLNHQREALRDRVADIGDPVEFDLDWQHSTDYATMQHQTHIDLQGNVYQAGSRLGILEAGITSASRSLSGSEFAGYESNDRGPKSQPNFGLAFDLQWQPATDYAAMLRQRNLALRETAFQSRAETKVDLQGSAFDPGADHGIHRAPERVKIDLQGQAYQPRNKLGILEACITGANHRSSDSQFLAGFASSDRAAGPQSDIDLGDASVEGAEIADASAAVLRDLTALAQAQTRRGSWQPSVREATARLGQSRVSSQAELLIQKGAMHTTTESMSASMLSLEDSTREMQAQFQRLGAARTDSAYLELLATVAGLEAAVGEATNRLQALWSQTRNSPPRFTVIQTPTRARLSRHPGPLATFVAAEMAALILLWLVSPWGGQNATSGSPLPRQGQSSTIKFDASRENGHHLRHSE